MPIINQHPSGAHPFAISLQANDVDTACGIPHRALTENGHNDALLNHIVPVMQTHHFSHDALKRRMDLIASLRIANAPALPSLYPKADKTQKGNFAEVFLAEYLSATTDAQLPVYRLRYNPNVEQSMKGDDVLLFDLDSDPVRIIVGEAKFRSAPSQKAVSDTIDGLLRSNKSGLPISLMFVADRLFEDGKTELAQKVQDCAILFSTNKLHIDYVGLLMSNHNAKSNVHTHTTNELHNLLMISLGMQAPEVIVQEAFERLEDSV